MLRRLIAGSVGVMVVVFVVAAGASGASAGAPGALHIDSASFTQDGQQLVWRVVTAEPFTPATLRAARQSLCLVIGRQRAVAPVGELCVGHSGSRSHPRLFFSRIAGSGAVGPAHAVAATVTRGDVDELTASFLPVSIGSRYRSLRWQVISTSTASSCSSALVGCSDAFPPRVALVKLHTPVLVGCAPSGPSLVYGGASRVRDIALTFDDGPWPDPPTIDFINLLARYHVPATFFEIGDQISEYDPTGSIERKMLADGDMIGDHTWTHPDMDDLSPAAQTSELRLTVDAIRRATRFTTCLWRPPYGDISPQLEDLARSLGLATIMWDIDPRDWALPGVSSIEDNVITNARNGGIVEEHFGGGPRYETLSALPDEITTLRARGYRFVTLTQMLGYKLIYR